MSRFLMVCSLFFSFFFEDKNAGIDFISYLNLLFYSPLGLMKQALTMAVASSNFLFAI